MPNIYNLNILSDRKKQILRAVIDAYIMNGEPVGSKYLTGSGGISFSSATVRNEMAELEEMGYLEQPHTSAGRIPSERGYRFYVDSLMQNYRLTAHELNELNTLIKSKVAELDSILQYAGRLMSHLTNYTSLMIKPSLPATVIIKFSTVRIGEDSFLLIMITSGENVITKMIHIPGGVEAEALIILESALNDIMTGISQEMITLQEMISLQERMAGYEQFIPPVMKCIYMAFSGGENGGDIRLEGLNRLLQYPEFSNIEKLSGLLAISERKTELIDIISNSKRDEINIYIGTENAVDIMRHATFIFKTINSGNNVIGTIGVIGPCRMDYSKVVTTVEYLAQNIAKMMNGDENDNPDDNKNKNNGG